MSGAIRGTAVSLLLVAALGLAACAKPQVPPILEVARSDCTPTPDRATAAVLLPPAAIDVDDPASTHPDRPLEMTIDGESPCLEGDEGLRSLYGLAALPQEEDPYLVRVTAEPGDEGFFAPRLLLLDEAGRPLREIAPETFVFRGLRLTGQFRVQPEERYLVVASDPSSVGEREERLNSSVETHYIMFAPGAMIAYPVASDERVGLVRSHGGHVTLLARRFRGLE